ncbi:DUF746 domain-containing protein [Ralstonia pseudosolanacearum]|nr:DUF746 domain-containing protein [Ralstonia pseudosolanacearum]
MLPQAIGCPEAARRLGVMERTIRNTVRMFRRWVLELDPSGHHERHIRLGGRFTAVRDQAPPVVDEQIAYEDVAGTAPRIPGHSHPLKLRVGIRLCL